MGILWKRRKCQGAQLLISRGFEKTLFKKAHFVEETSCLLIVICTVVSPGVGECSGLKKKF